MDRLLAVEPQMSSSTIETVSMCENGGGDAFLFVWGSTQIMDGHQFLITSNRN